jgi:hypothetical protein
MKYSIIISNITNTLYACVLKSWQLDKEGKQINLNSETKSGVTLEEALQLTTKFIEKNG